MNNAQFTQREERKEQTDYWLHILRNSIDALLFMFSLKYSELVKHIIVIAPAFEEAVGRF